MTGNIQGAALECLPNCVVERGHPLGGDYIDNWNAYDWPNWRCNKAELIGQMTTASFWRHCETSTTCVHAAAREQFC